MSSLNKRLLLPAAIALSPLLIAAGQLPNLESMLIICVTNSSGSEASDHTSSRADSQIGYVVQPISSTPRAIVTSEQEWLSVDRGTTAAAENNIQNYCINKEAPGNTTGEATDTSTGELPDLGSEGTNVETTPSTQQPASPQNSTPSEVAPAATNSNTEGAFASPEPPPLVERPAPSIPSGPSRDPSNFTPEDPAPTPFDGIVEPTLESLPDGSYRYLSGNFEYGNYTDQQIINNGGSVFLLTKVGENVVGDLRPRLDLPGICMTGTVRDDTISGSAYSHRETAVEIRDETESAEINSQAEEETGSSEIDEKEIIREVDDTVEAYGNGALQLRQSSTVNGQLYYQEAVLDLSNFSRINAGSALAPTECNGASPESE